MSLFAHHLFPSFLLFCCFSCFSFIAAIPNGVSMYEISTRPWLYSLSQKYGRDISTLSAIPNQELKNLRDRNYSIVWFMGVWQLGPYGLNHDRTDPGLLQGYKQVLPDFTIDDVIGSPYAVVNYTCNSNLGSDQDILALKAKLNKLGMKLMLDFVPNHSAVDCPWTSTNINYYVRSPKGSVINPAQYLPNGIAYGSACTGCGSWTDTAQFNYWDNGARAARTRELLSVASLADAIRCDMAYLLLNDVFQQTWSSQLSSWGYSRPATEWWSDSISAVKAKYPDVIFLSEVYAPYQPNMLSVGFDYAYDKTLYDKLGSGNLDDIRYWLTSNSVDFITHSAHFTANHDEQRAVAFFGTWWRADAAALLTYTLPGMRFYWMWEEDGYKNKLDVHLRREYSEPAIPGVQSLYASLIEITSADVFQYGTWTYLPVGSGTDSWRLIAYTWEYQGEKRLCVINYSDTSGSGTIKLANAQPINGNDTIPVIDLLSDTVYYRSASQMRSQGLLVVVNPWYAQIFAY